LSYLVEVEIDRGWRKWLLFVLWHSCMKEYYWKFWSLLLCMLSKMNIHVKYLKPFNLSILCVIFFIKAVKCWNKNKIWLFIRSARCSNSNHNIFLMHFIVVHFCTFILFRFYREQLKIVLSITQIQQRHKICILWLLIA